LFHVTAWGALPRLKLRLASAAVLTVAMAEKARVADQAE